MGIDVGVGMELRGRRGRGGVEESFWVGGLGEGGLE